ncbi:hypothetical protein FRC02_003716 [Tulasnella sp. 418]|nr:hypothetical protein FRC02_003716 [Tulasnella sp. 418]
MKRHASVIVPRLSRSIRTQFNTSYEPHERAPGIVDGWGLGLTTPRQLVQYLDSFVVGQERAKKILSVAVFNHYNRVRANLQTLEDSAAAAEWRDADTLTELRVDGQGPSRATFQPHPQRRLALPHLQPRQPVPLFEKSNVLIIGPTGSGKTLLSKTLARILDVPFATSDATSLTQAGYVGEDVESVIQRLLHAANWDPRRASMGIVHIDEADKLARRSGSSSDAGRDVGGEGVQQALLRMLEGTIVNVKGGGLDTNAHPPSGSTSHPFSGSPDESTSPQSSSPSGSKRKSSSPSSSAPPKTETYQVDTSDVLFILSGAFVGLDKIVKNRISKGSIGFGATLASKGDNISLNNKSGTSPTGVNFMPFFTPNEKGKNVDTLDLAEPTDLIKFG